MNDMFKKVVEKKKKEGKSFSPMEKDASDGVLSDLMKYINGLEGEKVKGLKKVTVASDSKDGLEAGMNKAKSMMEESPDEADEGKEDSMDESMDIDDVLEDVGDHQMDGESPDEDDEIGSLEKQLADLRAKRAMKG